MLLPGLWHPSPDGSFLSDVATKLVEDGKVISVPIMIGVTRDEGLLASQVLMAKEEKRKYWRWVFLLFALTIVGCRSKLRGAPPTLSAEKVVPPPLPFQKLSY
jgi:hypothetical protein